MCVCRARLSGNLRGQGASLRTHMLERTASLTPFPSVLDWRTCTSRRGLRERASARRPQAITRCGPGMREEGRGALTPTAQGSKKALLLKRAMPVLQPSAGEPLQSMHTPSVPGPRARLWGVCVQKSWGGETGFTVPVAQAKRRRRLSPRGPTQDRKQPHGLPAAHAVHPKALGAVTGCRFCHGFMSYHTQFQLGQATCSQRSLSHPQDFDGPMRVAAQRKTNAYKQTYADNQKISFLPAIMSTSNRMHGEFLRLLFL